MVFTESVFENARFKKKKKRNPSLCKQPLKLVVPLPPFLPPSRRSAVWRMSPEERRTLDKANEDMWSDFRQAAEAHRQVRQHVRSFMQPGKTMIEIW